MVQGANPRSLFLKLSTVEMPPVPRSVFGARCFPQDDPEDLEELRFDLCDEKQQAVCGSHSFKSNLPWQDQKAGRAQQEHHRIPRQRHAAIHGRACEPAKEWNLLQLSQRSEARDRINDVARIRTNYDENANNGDFPSV